MAISLAVVP